MGPPFSCNVVPSCAPGRKTKKGKGTDSQTVAPTKASLSKLNMAALPHAGSITLILGPMFSGKSTELMRRVRRFTFARRACLVCKYAKDQRYADEG